MSFVPQRCIESTPQDQQGPLIGRCPAACLLSLFAGSELGTSHQSMVKAQRTNYGMSEHWKI